MIFTINLFIKYIYWIRSQAEIMNRPVALVCYICGRQFGTKSLGIHIKACQKKWENQQNLKPPKQRRPCPQPPHGLQELLGKSTITRKDIDNFNTGSFNTFKEEALVQCQYCGRKFNPKSLAPHQKACKTNPMIRKPYIPKGQQNKFEDQPLTKVPSKGYNLNSNYDMGSNNQNQNLVPCRKCGRKFVSDRVGKHEKVCKGPETKNVPTISQKYQIKTATKPALGGKKNAVPKWKIQSQQLQQAMRQMRKIKAIQAKGGSLANLPPPPKGNYDHYVQCRYCGRKYAPDVAERHIPKCANIINKPGGIKPSKIQQKYIGNTGSTGAKQEKYSGNTSMNQQKGVDKYEKYGNSNYGYSGSNNSYSGVGTSGNYGGMKQQKHTGNTNPQKYNNPNSYQSALGGGKYQNSYEGNSYSGLNGQGKYNGNNYDGGSFGGGNQYGGPKIQIQKTSKVHQIEQSPSKLASKPHMFSRGTRR